MGCEKLSHQLLDLGFFCALGTSEHPGHCQEERHVKRDRPFAYDTNNGVVVVYDEDGRPWIAHSGDLCTTEDLFMEQVVVRHSLRRGAYVPHSNDGGHFVRSILPTL